MTDATPRERRNKARNVWVVIAVSLLLAALLLRHFTRSVVPVRMASVERGQLISTLSTNGKVEPVNNFAAYSPRAGTVKDVYAHEGEKVTTGQLLLSIDDSQARSDVAAALAAERGAEAQLQALRKGTRPQQIILTGDIGKTKAAHDQAAANLATLEQLQKQGAASASEVETARRALAAQDAALNVLDQQRTQNFTPIDLEHAQANVANAKAAYASALDVLYRENIRAPFPGTVYSVLVRVSDFVPAGDKLLQMADLKQMQIRAYFDEPEIGKLAIGKPVKIVWEARPQQIWHGHIVRIPTTIVTYGTRNVGEALISVDDSDETLLPNTNVTLTVTLLDVRDTLIIPREALHVDDNGDFVYQVLQDRLHRVPVKIGSLNLTQVQILSGINTNDVVALTAPDGSNLRNRLAVSRAK
ncbi:MAG: efflux RND transporter periplasmic adaptor subunit [Acidobacteriaceae bacterium]